MSEQEEQRLSTVEMVDILKNSPMFSEINDSHMLRLVDSCNVQELAPGDFLFRQGEEGNCAYVVLSGDVQVRAPTDAGEVTVATLAKGSLFGEIAAFSNNARNASVMATEGASVLALDQNSIHRLMRDDPSCSMKIIGTLGRRLERNNHSVAVMSLATNALAEGEFKPEMLAALKDEADRFAELAEVFENMAHELTTKEQQRQEMKTAMEIQRSFLPPHGAQGAWSDRVDLAAHMYPAKNVGGDFFDYFMIDEDTLGFAIGDVSGKGVPAAIFMSVSRTVLKTIARRGGSAAEVVRDVNELLSEDNSESMFVTMVFGRLNIASGELDYCSAGHEDAYIYTAKGELSLIEVDGPAVGLMGGVPFGSRQTKLASGDFVILGTDGITEAFDEEHRMFGRDRYEETIQTTGVGGAQEFVETIIGQVKSFAGDAEQSDDLTCLAVRMK